VLCCGDKVEPVNRPADRDSFSPIVLNGVPAGSYYSAGPLRSSTGPAKLDGDSAAATRAALQSVPQTVGPSAAKKADDFNRLARLLDTLYYAAAAGRNSFSLVLNRPWLYEIDGERGQEWPAALSHVLVQEAT
jgi:hypothetical protein